MTDDEIAVPQALELRYGVDELIKQIKENRKTSSGIVIDPETSLRCIGILACVRVLSEGVAAPDFALYEWLSDGGRREAEEHPLYDVLVHSPNSWMTSFEWREWMQSQVLLWGNGYSRIVSGKKGAVTELLPLHASRMTPTRSKSGMLVYEYRHPEDDNTARPPEEIPQNEVFHLRWLSSDGVTGYVPSGLSGDAIGLARATEIYSSSFFANGARAGTYIEATQPQKQEAMDRFVNVWNSVHGGAENAFKTVLMPYGFTKKGDPVNNEQSQLIEMRRFQLEECARMYRVPLHMLGALENVRQSTAEQGGIEYLSHSLFPWFQRWKAAIRRDLITEKNKYFVDFDTEVFMMGDYEARSAYFREGFNMGALDVDEVRAAGYKLNPLPGGLGKRRFVQVNMQRLEAFSDEAPTDPAGSTQDAPQNQPRDNAAEALFRTTLRKLAATEIRGVIERRNKATKIESWLASHQERMKAELEPAAEATGRDVEAFVVNWMNESRALLLDCLRAGKPYEEVVESWQERANLSDG
jgi:HK97 family phage portal protein